MTDAGVLLTYYVFVMLPEFFVFVLIAQDIVKYSS